MLLKQRAQRFCCGRYGRQILMSLTVVEAIVIYSLKNVIPTANIVHIAVKVVPSRIGFFVVWGIL